VSDCKTKLVFYSLGCFIHCTDSGAVVSSYVVMRQPACRPLQRAWFFSFTPPPRWLRAPASLGLSVYYYIGLPSRVWRSLFHSEYVRPTSRCNRIMRIMVLFPASCGDALGSSLLFSLTGHFHYRD